MTKEAAVKETDDQIIDFEDGEENVTVDEETEHQLLNMNSLGEVLTSLSNYVFLFIFPILDELLVYSVNEYRF